MQFVLRLVSGASGAALHEELSGLVQVANERSLVHVLADLTPANTELLLRAALRLGLLSHRFQFLLLCSVCLMRSHQTVYTLVNVHRAGV